MKKILFITAILTFALTLSVSAQNRKSAPSSGRFLKKSEVMSVDDLLQEASDLRQKDPSQALNRVKDALGIAIMNEDVLEEGKCYVLLGTINERIEEWKLALENFKTAREKLQEKFSTTAEYKDATLGLGRTNLKLGDLDLALQWYQEAGKLKLNRNERLQVQLGISEVYLQMRQPDQALKTLDNISDKKIKDEAADAAVENQRAKVFAQRNDADNAKLAYQQSQNSLRSATRETTPSQAQGPAPVLKDAKEDVAGVLHEQRRYDEEIDLRNKSIEFNLESNNLPEVTKDKVGIGKALEAKGETSAAIRELEDAAKIADTLRDPKQQEKAFLALADVYERNGRTSQALSAYKRYSQAVTKTEQQSAARLTEKSDLIKQQKDIEEYTKEVAIGQRENTIAKATVSRQKLIIYGLLFIILIIAVTSYFIYKNARASKIANQLLALKSLRSQMNPHFIFNALNSVNHFIAQQDERTANKFLSDFSRLMRLVMENSQEDFIPLYKEQEILSLYLKLEHYRFRDKFEYEIKIDEDINPETVQIPPMLLQPYLENAVWHGLRYKEHKGHLLLHMRKHNDTLEVEIADNGIGRKRSVELKTTNQKKQNSTGLKNIDERLKIINKVYHAHYSVQIHDLDGGTDSGTRVIVTVPPHKQNGTL